MLLRQRRWSMRAICKALFDGKRGTMLVLTWILVCFCTLAQAQSAFVRVNQVGYVSGGSKRAYLMSSAVETGATFSVQNSSGGTVFGPAAIGANLGSWSKSYPDVYALDFDSFVPGTGGTLDRK